MAITYTEEQLNKFDKDTIVQLFLVQQEQLKDIDQKLQLLLEQVAMLNSKRFGKLTEKMVPEAQIAFMEADGKIVFFNEAEAVVSLSQNDVEETEKTKKRKGQTCAEYQGSACSNSKPHDVRGRTGCRIRRGWMEPA